MPVSAREYLHPEDRAAMDNLQSIPLLPQAVRGFIGLGWERMFHGVNMAQKIRLGPNQLPELYRPLPLACEVLGIAEPEFYLEMDPTPNAYTFGDQRIYVTITSGLVEALSEEELLAVVAHECGHIACRHTLYHTMATLFLQYGPAIFGPLALMSAPLQLALLYWYRRSELSADRAAAIVMREYRPVVNTLIRLAGGPRVITEKINLDLYIQQADAYDKLLESQWDHFLQKYAVMGHSHPFLAVRAREILRWCESETFARILSGLDEAAGSADGPVCGGCGAGVRAEWKFCRSCGGILASGSGPAGDSGTKA